MCSSYYCMFFTLNALYTANTTQRPCRQSGCSGLGPCVAKCVYNVQLLAIWRIPLLAVVLLLSLACREPPPAPVVDPHPPPPPPCTCMSDLLFAVAWPLLKRRHHLCHHIEFRHALFLITIEALVQAYTEVPDSVSMTHMKCKVTILVQSCLINGLGCGLDHWTALQYWIIGLTFELKLCTTWPPSNQVSCGELGRLFDAWGPNCNMKQRMQYVTIKVLHLRHLKIQAYIYYSRLSCFADQLAL